MLEITMTSLSAAVGAGLSSATLGEAVGAALGVASDDTATELRSRLENPVVVEGDMSVNNRQHISIGDAVSADLLS